ncbi:nucleolar complex protein 2 homolog [Chenopodium quinoa]|uniref:nucleolar complex protein 2 homolog n=1 Tax=Chenopodium quinoa TaxID=63459 RepID=UPI000B771F17|nr:nucleolar complex protein 2 homolog [Chenopodium quinoa]
MGSKKKAKKSQNDVSDEVEAIKEAKEHKKQLEKLKETQPEFYEYLKEVDKELLEFDADDDDVKIGDDDAETDLDDTGVDDEGDLDDSDVEKAVVGSKKGEQSVRAIITMEMVESWCKGIQENEKIAPVRSLLKAFRVACHLAEESDEKSSERLTTMSKAVMNKVMVETLTNMDGILRNLMNLPAYGGKKEKLIEVKSTKNWKKYQHLVKSYLGNTLHALNQMTDAKDISFTLKHLTRSSLFFAAFPAFLRKYVKVALHFWGTGSRELSFASFWFLRTLCVQLGSDCLDECFKGLYKAYVMNCQFVNATKLQHIQFLRQLFVEFMLVDLPTAYQHAFIFIRQLAMILREALNMKTKESFRKVYEWKYINCLELWTVAIRKYGLEPDFKPLAYPLTQIISGVARLVPTARYFPLRMRCVRMLNCIAAATDAFIPVSMLLLDMLEMKELNCPPTGGVGKPADLRTVLKVSKQALKTRSFQEACVSSVIDELGEHLAQWSYSVSFFELSFIPAVRLRNFCKGTKVERFRKDMKELIRQIEANSEFTNKKRATITFLPSDLATSSFLEEEKQSGASPLSKYVATLRQKAQQRNISLTESSVLYGAEPSLSDKMLAESDEEDGGDEGGAIFNSFYLQQKETREKPPEVEKKQKNKKKPKSLQQEAIDEDIVEDLVLSSDEEDEPMDGSPLPEETDEIEMETPKKKKKQKTAADGSVKKVRVSKKGGKKRKRGH